MRLTVGSASDVGQLRTLNEDSFLVADDLFAVADGMGGHRGGEVASARALAAFAQTAGDRSLDALKVAVKAANTDVHDHARVEPELRGMGTTLCALAPLDDRRVAIVNVGDSRVYLLRGGALFQVSEDHSFVETLVREGRLTRAQADVHPQRNVITRALGIEPDIDVDGWEVAVATGDRFLLCSDGLFNEVGDVEIEALLVATPDPVETAGRLVEAANAGGGRDNITCVVVDVSEVAEPDGPLGTVGRPIALEHAPAAGPDPTVPAGPTAAASGPASAATARRRRVTWRTWAFIAAIAAVFGAAAIGAVVVNNSTYAVEVRDGEVVIVRGSDDIPFLGTTDIATGIEVAKLPRLAQNEVERGVTQSSRKEADAYVARLRSAITTTTMTTTTTTTTTVAGATTTVPPAG